MKFLRSIFLCLLSTLFVVVVNRSVIADIVDLEKIANIVTRDGKIAKWVGDKPFIHFLGVKNEFVSNNIDEIMQAYDDVYEGGYVYYDVDGHRHPKANIMVLFYNDYDDFSKNHEKYFEGYSDNLGESYRRAARDNDKFCMARRYHSIPYGIAAGFILVDNSLNAIHSYNCVFDSLYYFFGITKPEDSVWALDVKKINTGTKLKKSWGWPR